MTIILAKLTIFSSRSIRKRELHVLFAARKCFPRFHREAGRAIFAVISVTLTLIFLRVVRTRDIAGRTLSIPANCVARKLKIIIGAVYRQLKTIPYRFRPFVPALSIVLNVEYLLRMLPLVHTISPFTRYYRILT